MDFSTALSLYQNEPLASIMQEADLVRKKIKGEDRVVTWQIDRNINITNICSSGCKFCTFHCRLAEREMGYVTTMEQYRNKIEGLFSVGGSQILLQGGMHPELGIEYYEELFGALKNKFTTLKLHALGAPEVFYLAKKARISVREALERLIGAGLDSLPGAGAEILDNEWRRVNTPAKCSADEWLATIQVAQELGLLTSATMMYGFRDSAELRIRHLFKIRELQERTGGFRAFIAWPYRGVENLEPSSSEYLRIVAISRLVLDNVENIQASWLSVGMPTGQMALFGGANDMGSIMIEENVVSSSGVVGTTIDRASMERSIRAVGFTPRLRDQSYNLL